MVALNVIERDEIYTVYPFRIHIHTDWCDPLFMGEGWEDVPLLQKRRWLYSAACRLRAIRTPFTSTTL